MVLLIPDNLTFTYWNLSITPKEFLLAITVGCIFATLFIKATTIQNVMRRLKLDTLTDIEQIEAHEARALIHHEVQDRIERYEQRGYIETDLAQELYTYHQKRFEEACAHLELPDIKDLSHRILRMYAIGIEKRHLKELYHHHEVTESVFKRLTGKLQLQLEAIEHGNLAPNMSIHIDEKDVFDILANALRARFQPQSPNAKIEDQYMYYRAQSIISRKVLKELESIDKSSAEHIFNGEALTHVLELYRTFRTQSEKKMRTLADNHPQLCQSLAKRLALHGVYKVEETVLHELFERQLITPKLYIALKEELEPRV